ncbi:MAG: transporter [Candidatus Sulfotelmatobacter sp.]
MLKRFWLIGFLFAVFALGAEAQTVIDTCPYSPQHKTSLACLIPDLTQTGSSQNLSRFNTTVAQVIGQLPLAAPVSGFVLQFDKKLGIPVEENQNLGSVLTERGNTVGRHKVFLGFTYQRFVFQTIDGTKLSSLPSVYQLGAPIVTSNGLTINEYGASNNSVSANLSQYAGIVAFGLTDRIDVSVTVPFERVSLSAGNSDLQQAFVTSLTSTGAFVSSSASNPSTTAQSIAGSASGFGDLLVNTKGTIFNGEKSKLALGLEARFPTGNEYNLLGTGAYGVKPYVVFSRLGRITPHVNLGYQWNGFSNLYINPCHYLPATENTSCASTPGLPTLRLPDSVDYSGGADFGIVKRLTLVADFVGQHYFDSPRVTEPVPASSAGITGVPIPNPSNSPSITSFNAFKTVQVANGGINVDNVAIGLKWNPVGKLIVSANALVRLDDGSLRPARFVPLLGLSYRFGN